MDGRKEHKQRGVILIISIIVLIVLAGISIVLISKSMSEKTVSSNQQDINLAEHAAEVAVTKAKQEITDKWNIGLDTCTAAPCTCPAGAPCVWEDTPFDGIDVTQKDAAWWNTYATTIAKPSANLAGAPQYIVIDLGCDTVNSANVFRIIGRGVGGTANSVGFTDVSFSMPLDKNNIGTDFTSLVYGVLDGATIFQFYLSPNTISPGFWINSTCGNANASYAQCELNCAGQIRVMAWTNDNGCKPTYGQFADQISELKLTQNGTERTIACQLINPPFGNVCYNKQGKIKKCKKAGHKWGYPGWTPDPNWPPGKGQGAVPDADPNAPVDKDKNK